MSSLFRYIVDLMIRRFLKEELTLPLILILLLALVLSILAFVLGNCSISCGKNKQLIDEKKYKNT